MDNVEENSCNGIQYITEEDVKVIVANCGYASEDTIIQNYTVHFASDKMIGFLADYLKLQISIISNDERKVLCFFVKAISKKNAAKANMVKEMRSFEKELQFYDEIKRKIEVPGLKPWSAQFVARLPDAVVFEDLSALQYKMKRRHERFDKQHTFQALRALARFHAGTIIFEERKSPKEFENINDDLGTAGYIETDSWFVQCRLGAIEAVKTFSKFRCNEDFMKIIEKHWNTVFNSAVCLADPSPVHRNVICHRDLWNNNILFHYKTLEDKSVEPDDCVFVDFAAIRRMPPAGDVMQLLHCNLTPEFRKENLDIFLNYYYDNLKAYLGNNNVDIEGILTRDIFMASAKEQNLWGLVTHACLVQVFWLDDDKMTETFEDSAQFNEIMMNNKTTYIKNMMQCDEGYKEVVMEVFEEIIEDYILSKKSIRN